MQTENKGEQKIQNKAQNNFLQRRRKNLKKKDKNIVVFFQFSFEK